MVAPKAVDTGNFVVIEFKTRTDAIAAEELLKEYFPDAEVRFQKEFKQKADDKSNFLQRRLTRWIMEWMEEHPNRAWDIVDLQIKGEELKYSARSIETYLQELCTVGFCKRLKTGSFVLIKKVD